MRPLLSLLLALVVLSGSALHSADAKRLTVVDYFLKLPDQTLEAPAPEMWSFIQHTTGSVIDVANGYLRTTGDGAQSDFAVALFRYKDDRPLLAVCQGDPGEAEFAFLEFFEPGADGRMKKAPRSIFPLADKPPRRFDLPRKGRTIVVHEGKTGKMQRRFTWDGARFVEEK